MLRCLITKLEMLHIVGLHEIVQLEETTTKEIDKWKATPPDNVLLKASNGAPIQDGLPTDLIRTEMITRRCGLTMF